MISKHRKGVNEAQFLDNHKEMMELIGIRFEEFTDDLLPLVFTAHKRFYIRYRTKDDMLKIEWEWPSMQISRIDEIRYNPCTETEEVFVARVAAYLWSLFVFIVNM